MLKELFKERKTIVINTDIDGILSGILLVKYLGCKIVGFTNSKNKVWLGDGYDDLYGHVFVDMFVTAENAICIDQHIVAVDEEHQKRIMATETKFSPQIEGDCFFSKERFKNKYPFGTTQYLIAQLESEGITVELPSLSREIPNSDGVKMGDLIHRADDAMCTTLYAYEDNAKKWWDWLQEKSNNANSIIQLRDYLETIRTAVKTGIESDGKKHKVDEYREERKVVAKAVKSKIRKYFKDSFSCKTSDGGYNEIVDDNGNIEDFFENYVQTVGLLMDLESITMPSHYHVHLGKYYRTRWLPWFKKEFLEDYTICGQKVFSYAFIYSPEGYDSYTNFSFTINMK
jgi:hypothetical protein